MEAPGPLGERLALSFLEARGYRVVATNHRQGRLQADILAWEGEVPVVVEVKTRRGRFNRPEAGLTTAQVERLLQLGRGFFRGKGGPVRVDLVTVRLTGDCQPEIDLFPDLRVIR